MIAKVDFRETGAADLVEYIKQDEGEKVPVKDHAGRVLDEGELREFIDASNDYGWERHLIIAPDPDATFDRAEIDRNVRAVMQDWRADRPGTRYVYAVHDENHPHAHVALTGRKDDIHMDKQDIVEFRQTARTAFNERERIPRREQSPEARRAAEPTAEKGPEKRSTGKEVDPADSDRPKSGQKPRDSDDKDKDKETRQNEAVNDRGDPGDIEGIAPADLLKIVSRGTINAGQTDPATKNQHRDERPGAAGDAAAELESPPDPESETAGTDAEAEGEAEVESDVEASTTDRNAESGYQYHYD